MSSQVLRAVSSQIYEETVRYDLLLSNFSAVLDFVRIIGMALLVEKMSRKGASQEAKTFIVCILVALAFLTEVFTSRVETIETQLNKLRSANIFADQASLNLMEPMKDLFLNAIIFKGAVSLASLAANTMSKSD